MARLQSHVWIAAFLRAEAATGGFPAVIRRGAAEAGAIFIVHDHADATVSVYGPAPQSEFANQPVDRKFECALDHVEPDRSRQWLDQQIRFDADCWIIGTERRAGSPALVE